MSAIYKIVEDFQVDTTDVRVLVLDREYEFSPPALKGIALIDGKEYPFHLNSIRRWATINSRESFAGKTVEFT